MSKLQLAESSVVFACAHSDSGVQCRRVWQHCIWLSCMQYGFVPGLIKGANAECCADANSAAAGGSNSFVFDVHKMQSAGPTVH